jgi:uncharacterized protein YndB with AHSA1/START domain
MSEPSVLHASFVVEKSYDAPPARVFQAFADPAIHRRWFTKSNNWANSEYSCEFRTGGRGSGRFSPDGKTMVLHERMFHDIVPDRRIVSAYSLAVADKRISASLGTVELRPEGTGTRLTYTEQGAFFDGLDQPANRKRGVTALLDSLAAELKRDQTYG